MSCVYVPISTVGGAGITSTKGNKFGGFFLNGSAGGETLTVKNSATTILTTSAAAGAVIAISLACPVALTQIVATCSGTGFYTIFVGT